MKLIGRDIDPRELLRAARARLLARGLRDRGAHPAGDGPEPAVEPLSFGVQSLEQNEDPTLPLPPDPSGPGLGRGVAVARRLFRRTAQVFIDEALARQRVFNGRVRDLTAQLAAEVLRLRARVEALESGRGRRPALPGATSGTRKGAAPRKKGTPTGGRKRSPRR